MLKMVGLVRRTSRGRFGEPSLPYALRANLCGSPGRFALPASHESSEGGRANRPGEPLCNVAFPLDIGCSFPPFACQKSSNSVCSNMPGVLFNHDLRPLCGRKKSTCWPSAMPIRCGTLMTASKSKVLPRKLRLEYQITKTVYSHT
jgi:hypothetical protein